MAAAEASRPDRSGPEGLHFVGALGAELSFGEDGASRGRIEVRPDMWAPGTTRTRLGVLATLVDIVAGSRPTGPINPTVDLRIQLLSSAPSVGGVVAVARPLRAGRRLFVGEVVLSADGRSAPFGRATATFMNQPIPRELMSAGPPLSLAPMTAASFDEFVGARYTDRGVVIENQDHLSNREITLQGGVQALAAELAAERALDRHGEFAVTDLEIRYLNRLQIGPMLATAEVVHRGSSEAAVRVVLTDAGDGDRLVAVVPITCRRVTAD